MISGYFILEWLVYILVILLVLECIVSLLNDIIPLKDCEIFSLRWHFWNLPGYLLYGVLVCCSSTTQIRKKRRALYDVAFPHARKSCFHIVPSS